jgi:hypothetical protein
MKFKLIRLFILFSFLPLLFISCTEDEFTDSQNSNGESFTFNSVYGIDDYEKAKSVIGNYADFGVYTDGVAKLFVDRIPSGKGVVGQVFTKYRSDISSSRTDGGDFFLGPFQSNFNTSKGGYTLHNTSIQNNTFTLGEQIVASFGDTLTYSLIRNSSNTIYSEDIYIPNAIELSSISSSGIIQNTTYYSINRNNFDVQWNTDSNNDNGVLAVLTWNGDLISSSLDSLGGSNYNYRFAKFNDSGYSSFNTDFFDGIPQGAIVRIYFIRGNIKIVTGSDSRLYKIYGMAQR